MNDTRPAVATIHREAMMKRSPQDRFVMGIQMFDAARDMVIASIAAEDSPAEARIKYFLRLYQTDFPADALPEILNWIRSASGPSTDAGDEVWTKDHERGALSFRQRTRDQGPGTAAINLRRWAELTDLCVRLRSAEIAGKANPDEAAQIVFKAARTAKEEAWKRART